MPALTVDGRTIQVDEGERLVIAIKELGINIGHRCGGYGRCTTCRVEFLEGEPLEMTRVEYERLVNKALYGKVRLACQIVCDRDMSLKTLMTAESEPAWNGDTGPAPAEEVTPEARWYLRETHEKEAKGCFKPKASPPSIDGGFIISYRYMLNGGHFGEKN
ncbi:MAG: 2Fe-2S iron-sulfur cluster-binding protein [Anaerolineaceae bacterium]|nr:2Fe-2S iron-sulfur cluster-binding protein [Anaerolineaceae bacterium]